VFGIKLRIPPVPGSYPGSGRGEGCAAK